MRIAIDIRSLIEPLPSGVSEYTVQIIRSLLARTSQHEFVFVYNAFSRIPHERLKRLSCDPGSIVSSRIPSKLYNSSILLFGRPRLDTLAGKVDVLFAPNVNFLAVSPSCKVVMTAHDLSFRYPGFYGQWPRLWHRLVQPRRWLNRADAIIAVSESTKRDLREEYAIPEGRISVIPLGVDFDLFANRNSQALEAVKRTYNLNKPYVLYLGTVERRKNIEGILAAWELLVRRHKLRHELVIAGKVADSRLIKKLPQVRYIGYVPESDRAPLYQLASALVYPSYYEGYGLPVLEAMAAGTPVVASFSTSLPEVARGAAFMIDPYNTTEIEYALKNITTDGPLRESYINKGKAVAAQSSWARAAQGTLDVLTSLG